MEYKYLGDRFTDARFKGKLCKAIRNESGKCIRGKNGNMLVMFENGEKVVILARLLRKLKVKPNDELETDVWRGGKI